MLSRADDTETGTSIRKWDLTVKRRSGSLVLKAAHDAEESMRTGARVSPSRPGEDLRGRIVEAD